MGFAWEKVPMIREGMRLFGLKPVDIEADIGDTFQFKPHFGWKGHIETR